MTQHVATSLLHDARMPQPGATVAGRYRVERVLGEGGFAVVYRAEDVELGGAVALKVLSPTMSADLGYAARFKQEIGMARRLQHHNTIKVWDAGTTEHGCLYMAVELVDGEELSALLERTGRLPGERVLTIIRQVLRSLGEAHAKRIVHRDLKPSNIMVSQVTEPDYVKVLDFGIAKADEPSLSLVKTRTGLVMCSPRYAAPEVLRQEPATPAADVYSIGLILFECLVGRVAVDGNSVAEIIGAQISPTEIEVPPDVAAGPFGEVLRRACAKDPARRYRDASEMLAELDRSPAVSGAHLLHHTPRDGVDPRLSDPAEARRAGLARPRSVALIALIVALVAGGAVAALVGLGAGPDEPAGELPAVGISGAPVGGAVPVEGAPTPELPPIPTPPSGLTVAEASVMGSVSLASEAADAQWAANNEVPDTPAPAPEPPPVEVAPAVATIALSITSSPSNTRVYLDGELLGRTPLAVDVAPSAADRDILLDKTGYEAARATLVAGVERFERDFALERERRAPRGGEDDGDDGDDGAGDDSAVPNIEVPSEW